ncbi:hypothetical protein I2486_04020 [Cellulophaga sp. E16_2]|uniref:DUF4890 domain-containing protein n=1 Tax=Cellulophaga algicola (strain DSM 14237 / IC166 / ACAM 630) TaxID=688270 RepID=E6XES2_CELAD|nr:MULTISPECIES: hypothetical protein [Cellulophaga]ADV48124.1 hypothetical protein Celal_0790 [Cellulophaga algicola DSM 14237]MBO0590566.1 hypothetical protein [Cellulophaga sp. E16_2]
MKKVIGVLVLFIGLNAFAQKREMKSEMTPDQIATLSTKKMTLALDLTESQQAKMYVLQLENATERQAKMEARKQARENGATKNLSSDQRYEMQSKMLDQRIEQKKKLKSVLNKEQFEKWEKMPHHRRGEHHKGKREKGDKKGHKNKEQDND